MSTFVPIEARGGITLHPGPGPFAAGPGPFPARRGLPSACSCIDLSSADAPAEQIVIAAAIATISTELACFDGLIIFAPSLVEMHSSQPPR